MSGSGAGTHGRQRRAGLLVASLLLVALVAASAGVVSSWRRPAGRLVLGPGDTLFDHLDALRVERFAASSLPADFGARPRRLLAERRAEIAREDWKPGPRGLLQARGPLHFGAELGTPWVRVGETDLLPGRTRGEWDFNELEVESWRNAQLGLSVRWLPEQDLFEIQQGAPPPRLSYGYRSDVGTARSLVEQPREPASGRDLACEHTWVQGVEGADEEEETRPGLYAPAPTTLSLRVDELRADQIELAFAALDVMFVREKGGVALRRGSAGDGVVFALEVEGPGGRERLWQSHASPGAGFREERVDLSAYLGQAVTLRLLTEPGPAADRRFDYAVWGSLRLRSAQAGPPDRPHLILVDIDTLRADRLGLYGYHRDTSPRLDAWARREARIYRASMAASNWTLPSTVSLLTGLAVPQHSVTRAPDSLSTDHAPVAKLLRQAGYETRARVGGGYLLSRFGFAEGFERYHSHRPGPDLESELGWSREIAWLRERPRDTPIFYFFHSYIVHFPFKQDRRYDDPERPYRGRYADVEGPSPLRTTREHEAGLPPPDAADRRYANDLYDAAINRMDDVLMDFADALAEVFADEPYLLIITSDHGEEIFDRGPTDPHFNHGHTLHRELLEVPLIVRFPAGARRGWSDEPTSALDIVPTLLDFAGVPRPARLAGRSLRDPLPADRPVFSDFLFGHEDRVAVQQGRWKATIDQRTGERRLFDLRRDPHERSDAAARAPERLLGLAELVGQYRARRSAVERADAGPRGLDAETLRSLRALGYVE